MVCANTSHSAASVHPRLFELLSWIVYFLASVSFAQPPTPPPSPRALSAQEEAWLQVLRDYETPRGPGEISVEVAKARSTILRAPLEEMPPEIRVAYTDRQLEILFNAGNWKGVEALQARILDGPSWKRSPLDAIVLARIADFYGGVVFPREGGRQVGEDDLYFREELMAIWKADIYSPKKERSVLASALSQ